MRAESGERGLKAECLSGPHVVPFPTSQRPGEYVLAPCPFPPGQRKLLTPRRLAPLAEDLPPSWYAPGPTWYTARPGRSSQPVQPTARVSRADATAKPVSEPAKEPPSEPKAKDSEKAEEPAPQEA